MVPIIKGKCDISNCTFYRDMKLGKHGIEVLGKLLERRLHRIVTVNEMQFGFMPERGTMDAVFILRRQKEEQSCICFVDLDKAFDTVPRKVLDKSNDEERNTRSFG